MLIQFKLPFTVIRVLWVDLDMVVLGDGARFSEGYLPSYLPRAGISADIFAWTVHDCLQPVLERVLVQILDTVTQSGVFL